MWARVSFCRDAHTVDIRDGQQREQRCLSHGRHTRHQDQFKWEDVRNDKHRENYLGTACWASWSVAERKDLTWTAKDGKLDSTTQDALKEEGVSQRRPRRT